MQRIWPLLLLSFFLSALLEELDCLTTHAAHLASFIAFFFPKRSSRRTKAVESGLETIILLVSNVFFYHYYRYPQTQ